MKKAKFIKAGNRPPRVSIIMPFVWWLVLERFEAPGWAFGVVFAVLGITYVVELFRLFSGEAVDVIEGEK